MLGYWEPGDHPHEGTFRQILTEHITWAEKHVLRVMSSSMNDLALMQEAVRPHTEPSLCHDAVRAFLEKVGHGMNYRRRVIRRCGTAHQAEMRVTYNPHYVHEQLNKEVLDSDDLARDVLRDTILHELAHLFAYQFYDVTGHGTVWRKVCNEWGVAPFGCTNRAKRRRYVREGRAAVRARIGDVQ